MDGNDVNVLMVDVAEKIVEAKHLELEHAGEEDLEALEIEYEDVGFFLSTC